MNSVILSESGEEGSLATDIDSIFFMNFEERVAFKIISAHINYKINCWTLDSFDQRFLLQKVGKIPKKVLLNPIENI